MDFIMEYEMAKAQVKEKGWDSFLESFQKKYPDYDLYSVSTYWYNANDPRYICKMRGSYGDVVIGWKGVDYGD